MPTNDSMGRRQARFFREPTEEEVAERGEIPAYIHARLRSRILGSRALSGLVALGTGTAITLQQLYTGKDTGQTSVLANYGIPIVINGIAQIKVERHLRQTEEEILELLPVISDTTINRTDNPDNPV